MPGKGNWISGKLDGIAPFTDNQTGYLTFVPEDFSYPAGSRFFLKGDTSFKLRLINGKYSVFLAITEETDEMDFASDIMIPLGEIEVTNDEKEFVLKVDKSKAINLYEFEQSMRRQ